MRSHYDRIERIAEDVARLGYKSAAEILRAELPQTAKSRSGDLGEILAVELVEEEIVLRVPVRVISTRMGAAWRCEGMTFMARVTLPTTSSYGC